MCGSDGRSYRPLCQLRHQACLSGSNLRMIHEGESRGPDTSRSVQCVVNCQRIFAKFYNTRMPGEGTVQNLLRHYVNQVFEHNQ